jgi:5-methylcytosine-specific restriction endonuclease McrA
MIVLSAKQKGMHIPCSYCGKEKYYYPKDIREGKKYTCSQECWAKYRSEVDKPSQHLIKRVKTTCSECGKEFEQAPWLANRGVVRCSKICANRYINRTKSEKSRVIVSCSQCKKEISIVKAKLSQTYHFCNRECMTEYYNTHDDFRGENSPNWTGGKESYYGENWRQQRRLARERDDYTCQDCNITEEEYGQELSVHHLKLFRLFDNYEEANQLNNLISLCEPCHRLRHSGEGHPSKFKDELLDG